MPSGIKLTGGWGKFAKAINGPKFSAALKKEVGRAVARSGKVAERAIRRQIRSGKLTKNAALTQAIKGSGKPLVDFGELFKAVTSTSPKWNVAFAGIKRTEGAFNVAKLLHEGGDIPATKRMHGLFWMLFLASQGRNVTLTGRAAELFQRFQNWYPLAPTTQVIRIPARPFVANIQTDHQLRQSVEVGWPHAVQRALSGG